MPIFNMLRNMRRDLMYLNRERAQVALLTILRNRQSPMAICLIESEDLKVSQLMRWLQWPISHSDAFYRIGGMGGLI